MVLVHIIIHILNDSILQSTPQIYYVPSIHSFFPLLSRLLPPFTNIEALHETSLIEGFCWWNQFLRHNLCSLFGGHAICKSLLSNIEKFVVDRSLFMDQFCS
jgi:hypothetical protein